MKNALLFSFLFVVGLTAYSQPPQVPADKGATFGSVITAEGAVPLAGISSVLESKESANVKVTAKVIDVCPKKGCWMQLEMPDQSKVFVKMKDYGFFVPMAIKGKTVVIDGEAKSVVTSVDELKHYAEDARKSKEEIAAITEPKKEIRFTANGILVIE
ncbi:MAG TPA: DUF4920 domain-containing protein [Cyclobacteriaceae bacterium]